MSLFFCIYINFTLPIFRYERYEKNQVQAKHGAIRKGPPVPLPMSSEGVEGDSSQSKSLMDAPLIDFSGSEPPPSFSQVPSLANFQVKKKIDLIDK